MDGWFPENRKLVDESESFSLGEVNLEKMVDLLKIGNYLKIYIKVKVFSRGDVDQKQK